MIRRIGGEVTNQDLLEQQAKIRSDSKFDQTYLQLVDLRELMSVAQLSSAKVSTR